MDKSSSAIADRLVLLLDGREKYPWGQRIGLGKGVIDGMTRTGSTPGGETLSAIARCENARIEWLLDGRGAPFNVSCAATDEAAAELLGELLAETGWKITIVTDTRRTALVLDQPGSFDAKDGKTEAGTQRFRSIEYTIVEVLVGDIGRLALDLVRPQPVVHLAHVEPEVMAQLERGRLGTWRLLQHREAVLRNAQPIDAKHAIYAQFSQPELFPATKDEAVLLDHYRAMSPENRNAVNQVVTAMEKYREAAAVKGKAR